MSDVQEEAGLTRRQFMRSVGVAAVGIMAHSAVRGSASMSPLPARPNSVVGANDRLNYAVIGLGTMGSTHVSIVRALASSENIRLAAVCDVYEKRLRATRDREGLKESSAYRDYRYLLDDKSIDVVVIATPEHWHGAIAVDAMEAGKHVYCEKPMARRLDEAFRMYDTAKRLRRTVQVGTQSCSDARWSQAAAIVTSGRLGRVVCAQTSFCTNTPKGEYNYAIDPEASDANVDWRMWLGNAPRRPWSPERYFRWRKYWDYSAGLISDQLPHRLNPLMKAMCIEGFPERVSCLGGNLCNTDKGVAERRDIADTNLISLQFPGGTMILLMAMSTNEHGVEDLIRGQKANLYIGADRLMVQPERPFSDESEPLDEALSGPRESHEEHHKDLIHALRNGTSPSCSLDLAVRAQVALSMAEKSYREDRTVTFDAARRRMG